MLKQTLAQRQQQNLSAQQIQQIKLLELPAIELEERIQKELEANPALEEGAYDDEVSGSVDGTEDNLMGDDTSDLSLGDYRTEEDIPEYKLREIQDRNSRREEIPFSSAAPSINDRLVEQLKFLPLTDRQQQLAPYIIGNIEEDGYLHRDLEEILDDLAFRAGIEADQKEVEEVIGLVQSLDPPGICARDLKECLLLQLERLPDTTTRQTALHILTNHYDDFVSKRFEQLQEEASLSDSEMKEAFGLIMQLNPKPANGWGDDAEAAMNRVYPDFIVERMGDDLVVSLTRGGDIQPLRVSKVYQEMMQDYQGSAKNRSRERKQTLLFVKQKVDQAQWFIEAIRQRRETLQRTMEAIVRLQDAYFRSGELADLKPMILKDVADPTGYDVSTISRVSNSKYVQTDFGIFSLKHFFSDGTVNDKGEEVSTREVKRVLAEAIDSEDKRSPLNDTELAEVLAESGYRLARRTVAKYREQLGYPTARMRKEVV
ncbi:RNA polymerase sigma54 factor [Porphyromonas gulae]|uniref:RNA polymerase factor sigma-54 n=1 Tax=Porphyromonas TaxID=836 RepID=UPI000377D911|nr:MULTISPECIES: RNA polymerase factor sigma-54 [Porphyromonas]KGL56174.1 RNA polymerase sigma54 factor [Porphyromonas sp. COT-052 OH4946]KGN81216.1 RNA polymerase sigma54 factor [Porphyromonas gulae]